VVRVLVQVAQVTTIIFLPIGKPCRHRSILPFKAGLSCLFCQRPWRPKSHFHEHPKATLEKD